MKTVSIMDLAADLSDELPTNEKRQEQKSKQRALIIKNKRLDDSYEIEKLVAEVANILGVVTKELADWAQHTPIPTKVLETILIIAKRYKLNPLLGHIAWESNTENLWDIYIPIDGWIALIHRESSFQGITFSEATETEAGIPIWMECTIYRGDLTHPITVREYFAELKTEHPAWTIMPRRMLRHKTLQQCARLAFGISEVIQITSLNLTNTNLKRVIKNDQAHNNPKEVLRGKLAHSTG